MPLSQIFFIFLKLKNKVDLDIKSIKLFLF